MGWLFSQYERVQHARWSDWVEQVTAVQAGVARGVSVALSDPKKPLNLPPLPTWDEMRRRWDETQEGKEGARGKRPAWFDKYEAANRERMPWLRREDDADKKTSGG